MSSDRIQVFYELSKAIREVLGRYAKDGSTDLRNTPQPVLESAALCLDSYRLDLEGEISRRASGGSGGE